MESGDQQVMDMPVADVPEMTGGKKRRNNKNKKGGAIEVGSVLAPVVLYSLRRSLKPKKQRGGDAFSSQASPVGESTGPLLTVLPVVPPAGAAALPRSVEQVAPVDMPKEAGAVPTDSGDASLAGGAKKGKKGKKGPMAEGRFGVKGKLGPLSASTGVYGKVKAWGGDNDDKKDDDNQQDGGKKKRSSKKGGDKKDDKKDKDNKNDDDKQQDGGKKKRNSKKGGDKKDKDNKNDDDKQQDGGKKKRNSKKLKGGALDLYAQQLEQISSSLNKLLFN
jgi:hypothetical protein